MLVAIKIMFMVDRSHVDNYDVNGVLSLLLHCRRSFTLYIIHSYLKLQVKLLKKQIDKLSINMVYFP